MLGSMKMLRPIVDVFFLALLCLSSHMTFITWVIHRLGIECCLIFMVAKKVRLYLLMTHLDYLLLNGTFNLISELTEG